MIIGKRIRLRATERDDLPRFVNWLNDPEVRRGISIYVPYSSLQEEDWFEAMRKKPIEEHPLVIEIDSADGWMPIGSIGFINLNQRERQAEVDIFIGERIFWNQGYGKDAMSLMLRFGFNYLNLNRIYLRVLETNPAAIRCYENVKFVHEGVLRQAAYLDGHYVDLLVMGILRSEWQDRVV